MVSYWNVRSNSNNDSYSRFWITQPFKISDEIKDRINGFVDTNRTNAAAVIGIVDPNGTQFYCIGKLSKANNSNVNENTIFAIGSITKVFTTILLARMEKYHYASTSIFIAMAISSSRNIRIWNAKMHMRNENKNRNKHDSSG